MKKTIREAREAKGLSIRVAAKMIGCNKNMIQRWEAGAMPTAQRVAKICEVYEIDFKDIDWTKPDKVSAGEISRGDTGSS